MSLLGRLLSIFVRAAPPAVRTPSAPAAASAPVQDGAGAAPGAPTGMPGDPRAGGPGTARLRTPTPPVLAEPYFGFLTIRSSVRRSTALLLGLVPVSMVLALWWAVTFGPSAEERVISPIILPSPGEVLGSLRSLWFERALARSVSVSLVRVLGGFAVAAVVALPLGILMGSFTKIRAVFNPLTVMGSYLPIAAIVPLTLSWFGTGETQKVMFLAIASFVVLLPLVVKAIDDVDPVYLNTAYTLGASRHQAVGKVLVAVAMPEIFNALRLTFGVGWTYIILAEIVDAGQGLGSLIIASQRRGPREHIYLVLVVIMALAFLIDQLFIWASRALFPHRASER